jgi:hypothetical protein
VVPWFAVRGGKGLSNLSRRSALAGLLVAVLIPTGAVLAATHGSATPARSHRPILMARAADSQTSGPRLLLTRCTWANGCTLYTRFRGATKRLPIRPFELDEDAREATLGVGPHGHDMAVYDRCGAYLHDCGLYVYDFTARVERRLAVSNRKGAFMYPTVSGDRVAYGYNPRGRDGASKRFGIYWSYLDGTRMHRLHTEPLDVPRTPPQLALSGTHLAYSGASHLSTCLDQTHVRVVSLTTGRDHIAATGTDRTDVFSPAWDGDDLYYARDYFTVANYRHDLTREGIIRSRVERYSLISRKTQASRWTKLAVATVEPDGQDMLYQLVTGHATKDGVYSVGAVAFHQIRAHRRLAPAH